MFVRFSKRNGDANKVYRRAVAINNTYLVQDGNDIVAYGKLKEITDKLSIYEILIKDCDKKDDYERYMKRFIGNSIKWDDKQETKRRKYKVGYGDLTKMNFQIVKLLRK